MRYKQGKGDPAGFKHFLHQENIKPGVIVQYVQVIDFIFCSNIFLIER